MFKWLVLSLIPFMNLSNTDDLKYFKNKLKHFHYYN